MLILSIAALSVCCSGGYIIIIIIIISDITIEKQKTNNL